MLQGLPCKESLSRIAPAKTIRIRRKGKNWQWEDDRGVDDRVGDSQAERGNWWEK